MAKTKLYSYDKKSGGFYAIGENNLVNAKHMQNMIEFHDRQIVGHAVDGTYDSELAEFSRQAASDARDAYSDYEDSNKDSKDYRK